MRDREKLMHATADFNRPHRDVNVRGFWTMEEYLSYVETWSVAIFQPIVEPVEGGPPTVTHILQEEFMQKMWGHLRRVVILMMRPHAGDRIATAEEVELSPNLPPSPPPSRACIEWLCDTMICLFPCTAGKWKRERVLRAGQKVPA